MTNIRTEMPGVSLQVEAVPIRFKRRRKRIHGERGWKRRKKRKRRNPARKRV